MRAIQNKLKSRSGATILMALLFFLVAVMVSTVIISAANTATKTVAVRRNNQQTYLNVSSAAEYLRDAIQQEDPYQVVVLKEGVNGTSPNGTKQTLTYPQRSGVIQLVDGLFTTAFGGNWQTPFPLDPTQKTIYTAAYTVAPENEAAQVQADMTLEMTESDEETYRRKFSLTVNFTAQDQSGSPCKMTLKMQGGIQYEEQTTETSSSKREIYKAVWFPSKTEIWRTGLREETA